MSSNAGITIHGLINSTHTSQLNAQYAPNNIPTPYPLVIFSSLLSFAICCFGAVAASKSLSVQGIGPGPSSRSRMAFGKRKPFTTRNNRIPLQPISPAPPAYTKNGTTTHTQILKPTTWKLPFETIIYGFTILYTIFRCIVAFIISYKALTDNTTPLPAPSTILLLLLSTQLLYTNHLTSPLPRLLLLLSIILTSISFGIVSYAPNHGEWWPRYSTMIITSSNCARPIYAGDCMSQAPHWLSVGCGNWSTPSNYDDGKSYGWDRYFILPYMNTGDLNSKAGMNTLHATEMAVIVGGSAWWVVVLCQMLEIFGMLKGVLRLEPYTSRQTSVFGSIRVLLVGLFTFRNSNTTPAHPPSKNQQAFTKFIISWAWFLSLLITLMAIGGHTTQMRKKLTSTYLESFGPQVGTNFTFDQMGVIESSVYWGNESSWSDCFEVRAPGSRGGFWGEWVGSNRRGGGLVRVAAGL